MEKIYQEHQSTVFNWPANIVAMLVWIGPMLVGFVTTIPFISIIIPLVILLVEKESDFVRDHASKALVLNVVMEVFGFIVSIVGAIFGISAVSISAITGLNPGIGILGIGIGALLGILGLAFGIFVLVYTIMGAVKGYSYKELNIPMIGKLSDWCKAAIKTN